MEMAVTECPVDSAGTALLSRTALGLRDEQTGNNERRQKLCEDVHPWHEAPGVESRVCHGWIDADVNSKFAVVRTPAFGSTTSPEVPRTP